MLYIDFFVAGWVLFLSLTSIISSYASYYLYCTVQKYMFFGVSWILQWFYEELCHNWWHLYVSSGLLFTCLLPSCTYGLASTTVHWTIISGRLPQYWCHWQWSSPNINNHYSTAVWESGKLFKFTQCGPVTKCLLFSSTPQLLTYWNIVSSQ